MDVRRKTTARAARLGKELRGLRRARGLSQSAVADATNLNPATITRAERGGGVPQKRTVLTLLEHYRVRGPERNRLIALVDKANEPGWLELYHVDEPLADYITWESYAREALAYESLLVPGLLQTDEYFRALLVGAGVETDVEGLVEVRRRRQESLSRDEPLQLAAVIDEAVLHRPVGGGQVMAAQLTALAKESRPHVTIQVVPFSKGAHPGMLGSFTVLDDFDSAPLVCVESVRNTVFFDQPDDVRRYLDAFERLRAAALNSEESAALISNAAKKIKR